MRSTSVKFDQSESKIYPKVVFSFRDGRTLTIEDPDLFKISGNGFTESAGQSAFPLGSAIAKTATLSLWNDDDRYQEYDFYMSKFSLYAYKVFDEADGGAGREEILIGNFTVIEPEDYGTAVDVTGIDDMYKFDVPYEPEYTFPISLQDAVRQECSRLGISLLTTVFKNGDILIQKKPESITSRQFIGMAAQIASGNVKMDPFNRLVIQSYDFSPFESSAEDVYVLSEFKDDPQKSSDDVVITGVQIVSGEESFLSGETGYVLQLENQLVSEKEQQIADLIGADVIGFRFRPFNGEHFSVIRPEFMDLVYFTDRKGTKYQSVITDYDFQFSSYTTVKCSSADPIRNSSSYTSEATKAIVQARINAEKQISEYDKAVQMITGIMANSLGMYQTVEKTPSGGEIVYQHDKPLLSESKTIWKKTENGFMVSTDGGKTWNAGMDASGNVAVNVLSAIGLNAQWIDAGSIMVKDESGKIVFMVNLDTKEVIIDGSHIQIGDRTLEQALEETGVLAMQLSNDYANVPVDKEGNYKELDVSVKLSVFYGMGDITENCVFHITESQNISGKWSDATKTYTVESLTADTAWVEIQAVYLNKYTISKRFSVAKVYGGEDGKSYMMEASASLIEVVNGGLSPDSVTFSGYSVSEAGREEYAGRFVIRECDQNGKWETIYTSEQDETNITYQLYKIYTVGNGDALVVGYPENASQGGYGILTVPRTDIKEIECTLYASGGTDSILFMQRVSVIKNANALTQEDIFNMLTNNGEWRGIYKEGNQLFISFDYAKGGVLRLGGKTYGNGELRVYDEAGNEIGYWAKNGFCAKKGTISGSSITLGGKNNGDGVMRFYRSDGTLGGYIDNSGVHFDGGTFDGARIEGQFSTETIVNNIKRKILLNNGQIRFFEGAYEFGMLSHIKLEDYTGLMMASKQSGFETPRPIGIGFQGENGKYRMPFWISPYENGSSTSDTVTLDEIYANAYMECTRLYAKNFETGKFYAEDIIFYSNNTWQGKIIFGNPDAIEVGTPYITGSGGGIIKINALTRITDGLEVSGSKKRVVKTNSHGEVGLMAVESPEAVFCDYGSGVIAEHGSISVFFDPVFTETIDADCDYRVFITNTNEKKIYYVEKQKDYFVVRGEKGASFDWQSVHKQKYYSNVRMQTDSDPMYNSQMGNQSLFETNNSDCNFKTLKDDLLSDFICKGEYYD